MQKRNVAKMMAGVVALTGAAHAGEVMAPVEAPVSAGAIFKAKQSETVEVRFNGRMHFQYDQLNTAPGDHDTNQFYFRRLRLGTKAKLSNGFYGEAVYDFAGEDIAIDKAYIGYKLCGVSLKAGYLKVPFGFEETSSSASIPTIERSVVSRFLADDSSNGGKFNARHTGIHASGELAAGLNYSVAVVNREEGESGGSNSENDLAVFGRLQWSNDNILVGADYGEHSGVDTDAFTVYVNAEFNGLNLLGEYYDGSRDGADFDGYSVRASYRWGAWEPVIRYSKLDTTGAIDTSDLARRSIGAADYSAFAAGNEVEQIAIGVNYHVSKATKIMAGYEMNEFSGDAGDQDIDGFRFRIQLLW